jgi:hypothetical protein
MVGRFAKRKQEVEVEFGGNEGIGGRIRKDAKAHAGVGILATANSC